ncbi:PREDICTED: ADAMTS-like protein 1 [Galeopterus variegatus]|uniref:ADAMTS-like protein 1 n=1 Tax=Galeopterus variegatus TaxID=482537 RepID=A0ABM0SHM9_GALVR|nr:PREDICTED: ADAMTS-like protein 1 [Galeopterus variegatus]
MRTQQHHTACQHHNSSDSDCDDRTRPTFKRNCMSGACDVCWRPGPWRPCTAACGRGFQSRKVDCVHARSCKPVAERYCAQKKKPTSWRHCLGPSCDSTYPVQMEKLRPKQVCPPLLGLLYRAEASIILATIRLSRLISTTPSMQWISVVFHGMSPVVQVSSEYPKWWPLATWSYWALETWLVQIERYCKCKRHTGHPTLKVNKM